MTPKEFYKMEKDVGPCPSNLHSHISKTSMTTHVSEYDSLQKEIKYKLALGIFLKWPLDHALMWLQLIKEELIDKIPYRGSNLAPASLIPIIVDTYWVFLDLAERSPDQPIKGHLISIINQIGIYLPFWRKGTALPKC